MNFDTRNWRPPEGMSPDQINQFPVDARGADWRNKDIGNLDLREANLCRADLRGTNLTACQMENVDMRLAKYDSQTQLPDGFNIRTSGAIGPGAQLNGAFLNNADLRGIDLRAGSLMGAYLSGADLSGAILDNISLAGADLRYSILRGAMCRGTRFGTSELNMADLRGADLTEANLETIESIKGSDFSMCKGMAPHIQRFLERPALELDHWNPLTRSTTRSSLESLLLDT